MHMMLDLGFYVRTTSCACCVRGSATRRLPAAPPLLPPPLLPAPNAAGTGMMDVAAGLSSTAAAPARPPAPPSAPPPARLHAARHARHAPVTSAMTAEWLLNVWMDWLGWFELVLWGQLKREWRLRRTRRR